MSRSSIYHTRQRDAVLSYIASLGGTHVTATQIAEHFAALETPIGRTTIYRQLDKLTASGEIRRFITDGISGACYQLADRAAHCETHLHLKCDDCGKLEHLDCDALEEMHHHVQAEHAFLVNSIKTVLYGKCASCQQAQKPARRSKTNAFPVEKK